MSPPPRTRSYLSNGWVPRPPCRSRRRAFGEMVRSSDERRGTPLRRRRPPGPGPGRSPTGSCARSTSRSAAAWTACSPGDYRSSLLGDGTELALIRPYTPGDDVRRIDWNVTARTGEPHVRVHLAERVLVTWLVLDTSPSMRFGTADRRKADVAEGVAIAVGHLATRRGNRLGALTFGDEAPRSTPVRQGRVGSGRAAGGLARRARAGARPGRRDLARRSGPPRGRARAASARWS